MTNATPSIAHLPIQTVRARIADGPRKPSKITIPKGSCDPRARLIFAEMQRHGISYQEMEHASGLLYSTLKSWRNNKKPGLDTLEGALGAVGWSLVPVPRMERLPAHIREGLDRLAEEWGREEPLLHQLLAQCCRAPFIVRTGQTDRRPGEPTPTQRKERAEVAARRAASSCPTCGRRHMQPRAKTVA